jgi:1-deoxy-D-xylulose-5-phosphate synthase
MVGLLRLGIEWNEGPFSIRWPRDSVPAVVPAADGIPPVPYGTWTVLREGADVVLLATGTMVIPSLAAADLLAAKGVEATVVNCRFIKPLDEACLARLFPAHSSVVTVEEGTVVNGFGAWVRSHIGAHWPTVQGISLGIPDRFVEHGERAELLEEVGLTPAGIAEQVLARFGAAPSRSLRETA